ncbi:MAG: 3-dehydroquinate synthase [Deltaproteobacteria bacterium]|nr:MAG: 3-dehydroquinate synthase [Deltaproteobacteria bacterium]
MLELNVGLAENSYPVFIGKGCFERAGQYLKEKKIGNKYCIIADDMVAGLYGKTFREKLSANGLTCELIVFQHGEENKHLQTIAKLAGKMAGMGFDRQDAVIALGGGVTGDIAGFLASSYMRGIPFVQVPTTLLAQVDSSVGGKTGVDLPEGKNLVGSFYQPKAVFIDPAVLSTLPEQEILGGLAEVIKYGVIRDGNFLDYLFENREKILALDHRELSRLIHTCCQIKAKVVEEDEREADLRRILNYGHTIGHAVEAASDFTIIHGLAVSMGMAAVNKIAVALGHLSRKEEEYIRRILAAYKLPLEIPPELDRNQIINYLLSDKKTVGGNIIFIFPQGIGRAVIQGHIKPDLIREAIS